jgi:eukaryotic-like serine/threonine-protein kinase
MEDPKLHPGHEEKPGTKDSPGLRAPATGESSSSDIRNDAMARFDSGDQPLDGATLAGKSFTPVPRPAPPQATKKLQSGDVIGGRYEILELLGEGGMGAVYKASDRELNRFVALKLIRSDLASNPAILARFKQELLTGHQVTHKNVIRVYDLAEADEVKFITMEYIEGCDLRRLLLDQGKLPPDQAIAIIRQVCLALDAAHSVGVIHRDLKPQNIMCNTVGRILVMDFGLARSIESKGMTQTGALMGTIEYMSPEQSMGKQLDARSDLFAIGLIFYELLTNKSPYKADSAMGSLLLRNQERAVPISDSDASIPRGLSDIVGKCLERDLNLRYQSAQEILTDLDAFQGRRPISATVVMPVPVPRRVVPWKWIAVAAALLLLVGTPIVIQNLRPKAPTQHAQVSVLVADFTNHTGDPIFENTLEPMFNVALEGASFINAYNRGKARKLAQQLPHPTDKLDEQPALLVAVSQGIGAVVTGELSRRGDKYSLSATALDAVSGNVIAKTEVTAANKDEVLLTIPKLVAPIRRALGDTTPESVQVQAVGGAFTAASLETVHEYGIGMKQQFAGNMEEALHSFSKAVELDPNFARGYAGMAAMAGNLGQLQDAAKYAKLAMEHVDRMTDRERYRIRGLYYVRNENWQKCVEEYTELLKQYPVDNVGQTNLAGCLAALHNMPRAMEEARRAVALAPKDLMARVNFSLDACYAGDFQTCEREGNEVRRLNPSYEEGFLIMAYSQLGQGQLPKAAQTYEELRKLGPRGASLAASGLANLALYEGKYRKAVEILENGVTADLTAKQPDRAADNLAMLAYAKLLRGQKQPALAAVEKALANSQSAKIKFLAARTFVEAGDPAKARELAASLGAELQGEPQAYSKLILGEAALKEHDPKQALQLLTEVKNSFDIWLVHFDLGLAYLDAGLFVEADSEFQRCLERRGEAMELFTDDMPTYTYVAPVYYYQGRVREGLKSPGFADSYRTYLGIRGQASEDPLLPEIRQRLGQ